MKLKKYDINDTRLSSVAAFIWHLTSETAISNYRLLPVINTDLIINLSEPITYRFTEEQNEPAPRVHIRNVKLKPQTVNQEAPINVWGVSLYPFGTYPLLRTDMSAMEGHVIDLRPVNPDFTVTIIERLMQTDEACEGATVIEDALSRWLSDGINFDEIRQMDHFVRHMMDFNIGEYCSKTQIGIKRLERLVSKYTGISPKQLHQIARFQQASNDIIYSSKPPSLVELAYSNDYYDQMHLTKSFKQYAGVTPFMFLKQPDSMKANITENK